MRRMLHVINLACLVGGVILLVTSVWPGFAGGCMFLLAVPLIFLLGVGWVIVVGSTLPKSFGRGLTTIPAWQVAVAPILVVLVYASLRFYVPRRAVFFLCESSFQRHVATAPGSGSGGSPLGWVGPYHVDEYAADPRGGVYFRTGVGGDGIGPDRMSYGFVYQPNDHGTPFGAARYGVWRLFGDWYWFHASDDWH